MAEFTGWVHHLTHRHTFMRKPGVGELIMCGWRTSSHVSRIIFAPETPEGTEPTWAWVPFSKVKALFDATTPEEAREVLGA